MADNEKLVFQIGFDLDSAVKDATSEWKRVQRELEAAINARPISISMDTRGLERFNTFVERTYASLEDLQDLFPEVFKETKDGEGITKRFQAMETSINAVSKEMRNLEKVWNNLSQAEKFDDDGNLTERAQELKRAYVELYQSQKTQGQTLQEITKEAINLANQEYEAQQRKKKQEEDFIRLLNLEETTLEKLQAKQGAWKQKLSQTEIGTSDWSNAIAEVQRLETKIKDLQKQIKGVATETKKTSKTKVDIDTSTFAGKLKDLENRWKALNAEQRKGAEGQALRAEWRKLSEEAGRYTSTLRSAVSAEDRLANAKKKTTQATHEQNAAYKTQGGYLSRLFQRMVAYASVAQAFSFVRNVRDVTAEFELQRVALGSIIGDLNEANAMFEQIKAAAVKSPFQIKELVTYTKQLAAYKIESDELFETTQRLADISAGLDVGMERLVLAYGQIRATGYLRASEVRQLTEAGIPIVEELAKKMSQLRGETVSAAEVMGLISERAISFGMVKEVFDDMTSAGGMFYKMQEKQAKTLAGQWSNLKDTISIMYEEIGNTERVNIAMKGMIGLVKSLAENWSVVYDVAQSLSVAMGVYYVTMKNATVASKALSIAEVTRLSTLRATTIYMPKFLASTKLAITLTHAYRVAVIKSATATGLLSKAFWGLTKAMLSNPYTAVLAAVAALGVGLVSLVKRLTDTQRHIDNLEASIADIGEQNKIAKLVREFEDLSNKTNKTATEQERLKAVTKELASIYPQAISSIKGYGDEVEIAASKVKALSEAEREVAERIARNNLANLEEQARKSEERIAELSRKIESKGDWVTTPTGTYYDEYSDEQKERFFAALQEARAKLIEINNKIKQAKIELGDLKKEGGGTTETIEGWQKTLSEFATGLKNLKGEDVLFYTSDDVAKFATLNDALKDVVAQYEKYGAEISQYTQTLTSKKLTQAEREQVETQKARAIAYRDTASSIIDYYNAWNLLDKKGDDDESELSKLQKELQLLEKVYARYKEYRQYLSAEEARAKTESYFGDTIKSLRFGAAWDDTTMKEALRKYQAQAKVLPDSDKAVLEIGFKIEDIDWQATKRDMEQKLKNLSDDLSRTKTAKEFFDKMLGMTGDKELSANVTLSVYGTTGDDLKKLMTQEVMEAFRHLPEGFDITKAMIGDGKFDYNLLESWIEKLPKDDRKIAQSIVDNWRKSTRDIIENLQKAYEDYMTYEERKTRIAETYSAERKKIMESEYDDTQKAKLLEAVDKREKKAMGDIIIEEFKASDDWAKSIEDLENLATPTIERLLSKIRELIDLNKESFSPEQLKTLTNEYKKLYDGHIARNPFKAISDGVKEYKEAIQEIKVANANVAIAQQNVDSTQEELRIATERKAIAEKNFATSQDTMSAAREYSEAIKLYNDASKKAAKAEKQLEEAQLEQTDALDKARASMTKMKKGAETLSNEFSQASANVEFFAKALGLPEDSQAVQFLEGMANVFKAVSVAISLADFAMKLFDNTTKSFLASNPIGWILLIVSAIISAVQAIVNARVNRINEEIEELQGRLDQLEYSFERLEKAAEKAFGGDYIKNYEQQLANLEAQLVSYRKQLELERSKGKKADDEKIKEYQEKIRDTKDAVEDMYGSLSEHFLGTDLTSAARDFATAWLEAYRDFADTTEAMKAKFQDMIQNMIAESLLARVMERALEDVFKMVDEMKDTDFYSNSFWSELMGEMKKATDAGVVGAQNVMSMLESLGMNLRDTGAGLTGISRDIATASEESILGLAAGINTQNFYISQVPPKLDTIIALLQGGAMPLGGVNMQDLITIQNQHLAYLPTIAQNTAETVAECKAIVAETRRTADALERVIKPNGTQSSYKLNATLS